MSFKNNSREEELEVKEIISRHAEQIPDLERRIQQIHFGPGSS